MENKTTPDFDVAAERERISKILNEMLERKRNDPSRMAVKKAFMQVSDTDFDKWYPVSFEETRGELKF